MKKATKTTARSKTVKPLKVEANKFPWLVWVQIPVGLILSWFGIQAIHGFHPNWGLGIPLQLAAAFLVLRSFPDVQPLLFFPAGKNKGRAAGPSKKAEPDLIWYWLGLVVLLALIVMSFRAGQGDTGCFLIVIGMVGFVLLRYRSGLSYPQTAVFNIPEKLLFSLVLLAAALLRFSMVGGNLTGLQPDEANNLTSTYAVAFGNLVPSPFVTSWGGTPTMPYYLVAAFFKAFGAKVWAARLVSVLASLVTLVLFYRWSRFWMGNLAALTTVFLMGVSWWFLYFSLSPFHNAILLMTEVAAFYFLEKGLREGKKMDFWWSGIAAAACVMNYVPGRTIPLMMAMTLFAYILIWRGPFVKTYWKPLLLLTFAFFWFFSPFLLHALEYPGEVWGRVETSWIAAEVKRTGGYFFLIKSYFWTWSTLWWTKVPVGFDARFVTGAPFLDPVAGGAAILGMGLCLFNLRKPLAWVLIPGLFFGVSANALGQASPMLSVYVHSVRFSTVIPFVFLAVGWGWEWLFRFFQDAWRKSRAAWGWGLVALLALAFAINGPVLLHDFSNTQGPWGERGFGTLEEARVLNQFYPTKQLMVESDAISSTIYFLTTDKAHFQSFGGDPEIPIRYQATRDVVLFFEPWRLSDGCKQKIRATYPKAVWTDYKSPWGEIYRTSVDIPLDEIRAAQKGKPLLEALP